MTVWPLETLLAEDAAARNLPGLPAAASPSARIASLSDLGSAREVAQLAVRARDRSNGQQQSELRGAEPAELAGDSA